MKRDTRQEILAAARALFAEKGFNGVSTRDIAETLGISKGNLTYYFKKKEDIMEALIAEAAPRPQVAAPATLAELDAFLLDIQRSVEENGFYFWHHTQLAQTSPEIHRLQAAVYESNVATLGEVFSRLLGDGLLRAEDYEGEFSLAIDTLLLASVYWLPFTRLRGGPASFRRQAWSILHPLLSEKGRAAYKKLGI